MPIEVKHATQATGTDAGNGEIRKAQWNESHQINMDTGKLLGRSTAGAGAAEEIAVGSGLSLAAGALSATGGGAVVSATPPASPTAGALWFDTRSGALFTWYVGASSSAWVSAAAASPSIVPTFVSQATATTTSISSMPAHQAGDLLVMFAYRNNSSSSISSPTGWSAITSSAANTNNALVGTKVATSSSETSGTWSNATELNLHVYRGATRIGASDIASGSGTTVTYPALTLQASNGSSIVAAFGGHRSANTSIATPPTGTTLRSSTSRTAVFDTNGGVSSWTSRNVTVGGTASGWASVVVEILGVPGYFKTLGTLDFPSSPAVGSKYTQSGNTFVWNGTAWLSLPNAGVGLNQEYILNSSGLSGGTVYQNTSGKPITIFINSIVSYGATGAGLHVSKYIPLSWTPEQMVWSLVEVYDSSSYAPMGVSGATMMAIVPDGFYYFFSGYSGNSLMELR